MQMKDIEYMPSRFDDSRYACSLSYPKSLHKFRLSIFFVSFMFSLPSLDDTAVRRRSAPASSPFASARSESFPARLGGMPRPCAFGIGQGAQNPNAHGRSEEHTSELQS